MAKASNGCYFHASTLTHSTFSYSFHILAVPLTITATHHHLVLTKNHFIANIHSQLGNDFPILLPQVMRIASMNIAHIYVRRWMEKMEHTLFREKKKLWYGNECRVWYKKSIFRTTLDDVIRLDYASIDVACKHRIIREMMKILCMLRFIGIHG